MLPQSPMKFQQETVKPLKIHNPSSQDTTYNVHTKIVGVINKNSRTSVSKKQEFLI